MSISSQKKALLHVGKQRLQMEEADYRALLQRVAGVATSVELDDAGFDKVLAEFGRLGFTSTKGRREIPRREGMASPAQIGKIRALWRFYTGEENEPALGRWLEKHFHVSHVRFLKSEPAAKAVAVLTKMSRHPNAKGRPGSAT